MIALKLIMCKSTVTYVVPCSMEKTESLDGETKALAVDVCLKTAVLVIRLRVLWLSNGAWRTL